MILFITTASASWLAQLFWVHRFLFSVFMRRGCSSLTISFLNQCHTVALAITICILQSVYPWSSSTVKRTIFLFPAYTDSDGLLSSKISSNFSSSVKRITPPYVFLYRSIPIDDNLFSSNILLLSCYACNYRNHPATSADEALYVRELRPYPRLGRMRVKPVCFP